MSRHPAIDSIFDPADWREAIRGGEQRPDAAKRRQNPVDGGGAGGLATRRVDCPGLSIDLGAGQSVALKDAWGLIRQGQHTAGFVVRPHPAHRPRSEASGAVEQQDQHASRTLLPE